MEEGEIEISAVLNQQQKPRDDDRTTTNHSGSFPAHALMKHSGDSALAAGLLGLELGGGALSPATATLRTLKLEDANSSESVSTLKNPIEMHYGTRYKDYTNVSPTNASDFDPTIKPDCS